MEPILLDIGDFFAAVIVIIAGGALFYIPALILSFVTGSSVRLGNMFGPKVDAGTNLRRQVPDTTGTSNEVNKKQSFCVMYVSHDGTLKPIEAGISIVVGKAMILIVAPKGGTWVSNDNTIAAFDDDAHTLRGVSVGETLITYALNNKYVHIPVEVRQYRRSSFVRGNSTWGGDV